MKLAVSADGSSTHIGGDADGLQVQGAAAENAAVTGNPNLVGGRYDATPRTLGDGDAGAIALDADGAVQISDGGNSITVDGTITADLGATDNAVLDQIEINTSYGDNTGAGTEANSLRVTIANDSTGLLSIDDNGGSLTVDNTNIDNLHSADFDSGAGTDTTPAIGIAVPASGGAAIIPGDATAGLKVDLGADNDVTVTGTVTANLSATDNAVLDNIDTDTSNIQTAVELIDDAIVADDAAFTPATTKVMMAGFEYDDTTPDSVDEGDAGAARMSANRNVYTQLRDAAGNERGANVNVSNQLSVSVDNSPTLGANDGVDIGDVDVTSVVPGTGATNLGKAEDAAHTTGDVGVMALGVRKDTGATIAGADGDYTPFQTDASGNLRVNVAAGSASGTEYTEDDAAAANPAGPTGTFVRADTPATLTSTDGDVVAQRGSNYGASYATILDGSGNIISSFGGSGGTSHADDAAFTIGSASSITPTGYLADETTPDSVDEGDVGVPRMTLSRKPYAVITDATSENNAAVDGSGHLQVDIAADSVGIGGGTQYADDDALGATPTGTLAMGRRDDALTTLTPVEDDAVGLRVNARGALWAELDLTNDVTIADGGNVISTDWNGTAPPIGAGTEAAALRVTLATDSTGVVSVDDNGGALTVDNAGTFATQVDGAALTALQLIDDIVYTDDTSTHATGTSKGAGIMAAATPTDGSVEANDIGMVAMSTDRRLHVDSQIVGQDANLTVDLGATDNAVLDQIEVNTSYGDNVGNGTAAGSLRVTVASDTTGVLSVDDNGGSLTIDGTVTASNTAGDIAHDGVDSGNPVKTGAKAKNFDGSSPGSVVAENDRVDHIADPHGRQYVETTHPNYWHAQANYSTAQTDTSIKAAPGAGLKLFVTDVIFSTDTAMNIQLEDGTTTDLIPPMYFAANGGAAMHFQTPLALTANTALTITSSATGNHSVVVSGFIGAS